MIPTIGQLSEGQRVEVRAALAALGPDRLARLDGECFAAHAHGDSGTYTNPDGYCLVGRALAGEVDEKDPSRWYQLEALDLDLDSPAGRGIRLLSDMSDVGKFRARASVRALLDLARDDPAEDAAREEDGGR